MSLIAYYTSQFPTLSTTFVQREIRALYNNGFDIFLFANHPPQKGNFHPHDQDFIDKTYYVSHCSLFQFVSSLICTFLKNPFNFLCTLFKAVQYTKPLNIQIIENLRHFCVATLLGRQCVKNGITHIHIHFAFGAASVALFCFHLYRIPYSISIHGTDVLFPQPLIQQKLEYASFIISNCFFHKHNLCKKYSSLQDKRFHIVRLGIDLHSEKWQYKPIDTPCKPFRILNIGRLLPVKAQEYLIQACAVLVQKGYSFECHIVGNGPEYNNLMQLTESLHLKNTVCFKGGLFEDEVIKEITWAHTVVLSSRSEGTPMVLIESMAIGRAVIAPDITAIPEMIIHKKNGLLFKQGSVVSLAESLVYLYHNISLCNSMGLAGRKRAETLYEKDANIKQLISFFKDEIPLFL